MGWVASTRVSFALLLLVARPAVGIVLFEVDRQVVASTAVASPPSFRDFDGAGVDSQAPGRFFEAAVSSVGLGDVTNANAEALQDSIVELESNGMLRAEAGASAGAAFDVFDPGFPSRALASGNTTLAFLFELEQESPISAGLALQAELIQLDVFSTPRPVSVSVHARALLVGASTGIVFERFVEDLEADGDAVTDTLSFFGTLPADTYLFEAVALTELEGFEDSVGLATSGFGFDVRIVPEPGTGALVALGLAALARAGRRRTGGG